MKHIINVLIVLFFLYVACGFISWEWNITTWNPIARAFLLIIGVLSYVGYHFSDKD